jgi:hypothetical protein
LLDNWATIIKPAIDFATHSGWVEVEVYVMGATACDETPIDFLYTHDGHVIILEDEYGRRSALAPAPSGVSDEGAAWAAEAAR